VKLTLLNRLSSQLGLSPPYGKHYNVFETPYLKVALYRDPEAVYLKQYDSASNTWTKLGRYKNVSKITKASRHVNLVLTGIDTITALHYKALLDEEYFKSQRGHFDV